MNRHEKIYLPKISPAAGWENFLKSAKALFGSLLPAAKIVSIGASAAFGLLLAQFLAVGVFDRLGISPKFGLLISCLVYAIGFAGLAIGGGLKRKTLVIAVQAASKNSPVCKRLFIKRKS